MAAQEKIAGSESRKPDRPGIQDCVVDHICDYRTEYSVLDFPDDLLRHPSDEALKRAPGFLKLPQLIGSKVPDAVAVKIENRDNDQDKNRGADQSSYC